MRREFIYFNKLRYTRSKAINMTCTVPNMLGLLHAVRTFPNALGWGLTRVDLAEHAWVPGGAY